MINNGVIVLGGHVQSLGIVRIFGKENIPVIIIDNTSKNIARHSKYCCKAFVVGDDELLDYLVNLGKSKKHANYIIFPTNDFHVKILSQNKEILKNYFHIAIDNWNTIEVFYNKIKTYTLAKNIGIPIANTYFPSSIDDLESINITFPCIIKPAVMHEFYRKTKKKVFICSNINELKQNYTKALEIIPSNEIIVQNIIKGSGNNQFSAGFLFLNGKTYACITACRMRQHPIDFGNATTYAETVDLPIIQEYSEKILSACNFNGICEVEYKKDETDGKYKFLEVNTRTWKWHSIANKTNTPFLKMFYNYILNREIEPIIGFKHASFRHSLTDLAVQIKLLSLGKKNAFLIKKPTEKAVWSWDDLMPWIYEKINLLYLIKSR